MAEDVQRHASVDLDEYAAYERVGSCSLCGSEGSAMVDTAAAVRRCQSCGHRYVDPRPTQEEIARGYSQPSAYDDWLRFAGEREAMWRRRFHRVLSGAHPGRLLDVGAGIGTFLSVARDAGWSVEGTEVSMSAISHATTRYGLALRLGILEDAALTGPFDAVSMWHVVEHLPRPADTLRLCHSLLRDRGRLIMAMPNDGQTAWALTVAGNVLRRLLKRQPSSRYERLRPGVESHIQHFDESSIRRLLEGCGFVVDEIGVDDANPRRRLIGSIAFWLRRLLTTLSPWNFGREMLVLAHRA